MCQSAPFHDHTCANQHLSMTGPQTHLPGVGVALALETVPAHNDLSWMDPCALPHTLAQAVQPDTHTQVDQCTHAHSYLALHTCTRAQCAHTHANTCAPACVRSPYSSRPASASVQPRPSRSPSAAPPSPYMRPASGVAGGGAARASPGSVYASPPSAVDDERQPTPQQDQLQALARLCTDLDK